ncbi:MAG TPA: preprotein translocase subunit SecA, partial [Planctomycetaceae bacterium]|nr:preprotein translocase subunit SecA [Planctomycetaceae bacterium]
SETSFELNQPAIVQWAQARFDAKITEQDLAAGSLQQLSDKLFAYSQQSYKDSEIATDEAMSKVQELFNDAEPDTAARYAAGQNGTIETFVDWLNSKLGCSMEPEKLAEMDEEQVKRRVMQAIDDRFQPEIRRMERQVLLQIVDSAWKDHLLAMDHLRSAISLKGYAQMDPKVEYKREGMRMYGDMWFSIGERMTDLIFR